MVDKRKTELSKQCPVIVSEMRLDFNEITKMNKSIVDLIVNSDVDVLTKAGMLSRILPGLSAEGACACSCACSCSCSCS
jgi:hypothetical protein